MDNNYYNILEEALQNQTDEKKKEVIEDIMRCLKQMNEIKEIINQYHENFMQWNTFDSASAFHSIAEIVSQDKEKEVV